MPKGEINPIRTDIPKYEIDRRIKDLEKSARVLKRLYFIKFRYEGDHVEKAASRAGVSKKLGYIWQDRWNVDGFSGLIPRFAGGRPSRLHENQRSALISLLEKRDDWTTKEVRSLIKEKFGIGYSMKHVRELLRSMDMHFGKPYQHDYRRPKDAGDRLKKN